jgi:hypothetical protein
VIGLRQLTGARSPQVAALQRGDAHRLPGAGSERPILIALGAEREGAQPGVRGVHVAGPRHVRERGAPRVAQRQLELTGAERAIARGQLGVASAERAQRDQRHQHRHERGRQRQAAQRSPAHVRSRRRKIQLATPSSKTAQPSVCSAARPR